MYWKSIGQQNLPVTLKYSETVPHFEENEIPDFGRDNLWFLYEISKPVSYDNQKPLAIAGKGAN